MVKRETKVAGVVSALLVFLILISSLTPVGAVDVTVTNGTQFKDISGNVIHAHGGGLLLYGGYYYWYGEHRDNSNYFLGVSCYRSVDLKNWEYRGDVLKNTSASELNKCWIERPKVMYNASTKQFVMWMHWENGVNYGQARAAVAYCSTPDGGYTYQGSFRPLQDSGITDHSLPGYMSRDCNVFVDADGTGYFISTSNENMDLCLYRLSSDYRSIASLAAKLFAGQQREAPCIIKRNNYYYLITSGCTGWTPNQAKYAYSTNITGGWSGLYNLGDSKTYSSQPAFIIPVQGPSATTYLYTGDRWAGAWGGKVMDSQYVWLPLTFNSATSLTLNYYDVLTLQVTTLPPDPNQPTVTASPTGSEGKVGNPGLETGSLSPWYAWNDASVAANNSHSGQYCLKVGNGPASAEQKVTVKPNTTYTLSAYGTAPSGQEALLGVKDYGGAQLVSPIKTTGYSGTSVTFTTGVSDTQATIFFYHQSGTGYCYGDDFLLTEGNGTLPTPSPTKTPIPTPTLTKTPISTVTPVPSEDNTVDYKVETVFEPAKLGANQMITAKVTATNVSKTPYDGKQDVLVIVGLYDRNNTMVNVSYISKGIAYRGTETLSAGFKLPPDIAGYTAKAFMWDGTDIKSSNMIPLSNVVMIS